ncbi:LysR family transcriptional regulator [Marinobacterium nitratireducens]|uniref:LysR family transcriptional regulator n=1 Tax=Marinobacterium nitratireducens TaxID=518897 RepID=A0A918DP69_9GAMM|nr:LysR family transcriptional regulator [Marinobacterium nitratireducens]GGO75927.1 LysR family transcriptional regulator [Marinobacterium nitratireducens]
METHNLHAFVTVAETGSFSQAATALCLTQSAVSKRVSLLEEQLATRLFDRIGRTVSLTEAGHALLPRARRILLELDDARRLIGNLSGEVRGPLKLAASHHISLHRLPPILRAYSQRFPDVSLELRFDESERAFDGIIRGELELALITLAPNPPASICQETVWQDPLRYVVSRDHPLAGRRAPDLEELTHFAAILPGASTFTRQIVETQFAQTGLPLHVGMTTNYMDTVRMMVSIGLGWSLLPETLIDDRLQILEIGSAPIVRQLGYIYHRNRTLSNAARHLVEMLQEQSR